MLSQLKMNLLLWYLIVLSTTFQWLLAVIDNKELSINGSDFDSRVDGDNSEEGTKDNLNIY